jgi:hypothetical protein
VRKAFAAVPVEIATRDERVVTLSGAIATRLFDPFKDRLPDRSLNCDLPEFLSDPGFPPAVERLLFRPTGSRPSGFLHLSATDWTQISQTLL